METVMVGPQRRRGRKRKIDNVPNVMVDNGGEKKIVKIGSFKLVGRYVRKEFQESGVLLGRVTLYDSGFYRINYEDGHCEDLIGSKVKAFLFEDSDLTGEWHQRKELLDEFLSSKDLNTKALMVDDTRELEHAKPIDSPLLSEMINGETADNEVVEFHNDDGNVDVDPDSSSETSQGTREGETEVPFVRPPELPPSSGHIGIMEEYVSHLLSVYSLLRSFSVRLFLYPFGLDDFVGALNCSAANTLLDSVHVALMRVLKRQIEKLSSDGSELAYKFLRCLDWSLLDTLTWPIYLIHYLMVMACKNGDDWKEFYTHCLERDYYSLPVGKKLIVLQILCEDVLDTEELRTEMDMRQESEVGIDIDTSPVVGTICEPRGFHPRFSTTSAGKDLEAVHSVAEPHETKSRLGNHFMQSQVGTAVGNSFREDGNGDECCLCGMDGFLVCCDGCPSSYHSRCLGMSKTFMPDGLWYCPECKINASEPKILRGTTLRGGNIIGVDSYKQVFVASCDHLLVLNTSINSENCLRYYNRSDIPGVLHALYSDAAHAIMYSEIGRGIVQYWEFSPDILPCNKMTEIGLQLANKEASGHCVTQLVNLQERVQEMTEPTSFSSLTGQPSDPCELSQQNTPCVAITGSTRNSNNNYNRPVNGSFLEAKTSLFDQELNRRVDRKACASPCDWCLYMGSSFKTTSYINHYLHGDFAASAAANLAVLSCEENQVRESLSSDNQQKVMSNCIAIQVKAFSLAAMRFFWPNTEKKLVEVPRERCGWCFSCKAAVISKKGCLLNAAASNAIKGSVKVLAGARPLKNVGDVRLSGIGTYIMFMEESLSGLLVGPFLSDTFRKQWRKQVEQATSCNAIKILLLELEENIRSIALSGDWMKLVEGFSTQPFTSQIAASAAGSTQKCRPGRRGKKVSVTAELGSDGCLNRLTDFTWWRGGILRKLMFQNGILPCSIIKKSARQGGIKKIPGIHYVEGSETPKSSKQLVWRSGVEMSRSVAQLAVQVRDLDFHVRWGDLVRPEQMSCDGKGPEGEASAFRNAFICDKKIVKQEIRYCVAFGSQKRLPFRVMKNIAEIERIADDGKERYWFSQTYIPLYLIKEYEQQVEEKKPVGVLSKVQRRQLKASHKNIFSILMWKQENTARSCCSCHQDVFYGDAVKCSACQGFCHKQCGTSSTVNMSKEVEYLIICKQCCETLAATEVESDHGSPTSPLLLQGQDFPNPATATKSVGCKGSSAALGALERSSELKPINYSAVKKKTRKSNWGLIWRKKHCEDTGFDFRLNNILLKGNAERDFIKPVCRLCNQPYNADLMYIRCETCKHWFHADSVELNESMIFSLVGFKCCKCRKVKSPVCPYLDPWKKKVLEDKIERQQAPKQEISTLNFNCGTISEPQKEVGPAYSDSPRTAEVIHVAANDHLLASRSKVKQCTEGKSEANYGWKSETASSPGPRELPVRRHVNQEKVDFCEASPFQFEVSAPSEANVFNSIEKMLVRRSKKREANLDCCSETNSFRTEASDLSSETNAVSPDDGGRENGDKPPENVIENRKSSSSLAENVPPKKSCHHENPFAYVETTTAQIASCKFCSNTEPWPDLSCQICGMCIHRICSPWFETSCPEDGWRCGGCRDWR